MHEYTFLIARESTAEEWVVTVVESRLERASVVVEDE